MTQNITINLHHDGVDPILFNENLKLSEFYDLLSINIDR